VQGITTVASGRQALPNAATALGGAARRRELGGLVSAAMSVADALSAGAASLVAAVTSAVGAALAR
jgi:hypothetical protein